jgi:hypothetical protein
VNRQHLLAFLWLRWRLLINQLRRGGISNVIVLGLLAAVLVPMVPGLFVAGILVGLFALPQVDPEYLPMVLLFVWDGLVVLFLFFWMIGLMTELQRSEVLALNKFLHLPVSLTGAFLINYLGSLLSVNLLLFVPAVLGLALGLAGGVGPQMLLLLPAAAALLLAVTALTYQFQGWMASLMSNPRRRRTVLVLVMMTFILVFQLPNLINILRPWEGPIELAKQEDAEQAELNRSLADGKLNPAEFQQRQQELRKQYKERAEQRNLHTWEQVQWYAQVINTAVPPGWLPLGAWGLAQGDAVPALLGTVGLGLIGSASLWRAYRTTVRLYTGQFTAGQPRPGPAVPAAPTAPAEKPRGRPLVDWDLPLLSEPAAAIALSSFRSLLRAPEAKMMLLSPIIMVLVFGSIFAANRAEIPQAVRPLLAYGAMGMVLLTLVQFVGNQFGFDRAGFRVFVLSPAPRHDILLGKNVALAPFALGMGIAMAALLEIIYPMTPDYFLAVLLQLLSMFLIYCALANLLSILAPLPIAAGSMKPVNPRGIPVLLQLMLLSLLPLVLSPTLLPLGTALLLDWLEVPLAGLVGLVLSVLVLALVVLAYRVVLTWEGRLLQAREQKILEVVTAKTE